MAKRLPADLQRPLDVPERLTSGFVQGVGEIFGHLFQRRGSFRRQNKESARRPSPAFGKHRWRLLEHHMSICATDSE